MEKNKQSTVPPKHIRRAEFYKRINQKIMKNEEINNTKMSRGKKKTQPKEIER